MSKVRLTIIVIAVFVVGTAVNGCYTMLRHPQVITTNDFTDTESITGVNHTERCTDCHTGQIHGSMYGYGSRYGWYDYDPFWGYNNYYDPWFGNTWYSSPYFYDNYYRYNTMPWWVYDTGNPGSSDSETGDNEPVQKGKPVRRNIGSDSGRRYTPPADQSTQSGVQKPSAQPSGSSGNDTSSDGSQKQKPQRRGDLK